MNKKVLSYFDIKIGMKVKDELNRVGKVIAKDDIDNILVSFGKGQSEYFSLREDNPNGVSKLYKA